MQFGDEAGLRRLAIFLRDEATDTERAARRAHAHVEELVATAGKYERAAVHALAGSWSVPNAIFGRVVASSRVIADALDDLARAIAECEGAWSSVTSEAYLAGFSVTAGDGWAQVTAPSDATDAQTSHAARLEGDLRALISEIHSARRVLRSRIVNESVAGLASLEAGRGHVSYVDTGDGVLSGELHDHLTPLVGAFNSLAKIKGTA